MEWPTEGPEFNRWNKNSAALVSLVQQNPDIWLRNSKLKYLNFRIDTRSGNFRVMDRDGDEISPDDIMAAIREARSRYGSKPE